MTGLDVTPGVAKNSSEQRLEPLAPLGAAGPSRSEACAALVSPSRRQQVEDGLVQPEQGTVVSNQDGVDSDEDGCKSESTLFYS
jgi:hypothetical protein